jgi:hypothetical protein
MTAVSAHLLHVWRDAGDKLLGRLVEVVADGVLGRQQEVLLQVRRNIEFEALEVEMRNH